MTSLTPEPNPDETTPPPIPHPSPPKLLELAERHERADMYVATDILYCESFDCHVSITVLPTNQEIPEDRVGLAGFVV